MGIDDELDAEFMGYLFYDGNTFANQFAGESKRLIHDDQ
jgi:hypothetical protein